jgi:hypothetical protein
VGIYGPLAGTLAGGQELNPGALSERARAHRLEHLVRNPRLAPGVAAPALAA